MLAQTSGRLTLALLVAAATFLNLGPTFVAADGVCDVVVDVVGQGPSCPAPEGWLVLLGNGNTVRTHGPDPAPVASDENPASHDPILYGPYASPKPPVCSAAPHMRVIYARPDNVADRYTTIAPIVRDLVYMANGLLAEEAATLGSVRDYKVRCTNSVMTIDNVVLPTNNNVDSFNTIVTDLQNQGFSSTSVKYWVYYDDHVGNFGGQGSIDADDRLLAGNANNVGPDYAITYGYLSVGIMMHENGHNQGAVQNSAPHTSGAFHCNDGQDIMCYDDGGPTSNYNPTVCLVGGDTTGFVRQLFDCGHNDYFHTNPPVGNYLRTHWNLGSTLNKFIAVPVAA